MNAVKIQVWIVAVLTSTYFAVAQMESPVPTVFNYQGRLIDGTNLVNGVKQVAFRIYDGPVADYNFWTGVTAFYAQTTAVTVVDGIFSVAVGGQTNDMMVGDYPLSFLSDPMMPEMGQSNWWLEVSIDGVALTPREPLRSVPYALMADKANSLLNPVDEYTLGYNAVQSWHIKNGEVYSSDIQNGTIQFLDIGQNGAADGQVMKWNGSAWIAANDLTEGTGGTGTSDHGSLTGLSDDDHTQYLRSNASDTHTAGTLTISSASTLNVDGALNMDGPVTKATTDKVANLNADQLDSLDSAKFLRSDVDDGFYGSHLTIGTPGSAVLLEVNDRAEIEELSVGRNYNDDDDIIRFDANAESLMWDESAGEFVFSDDLRALDINSTRDIVAADDVVANGALGAGTSDPQGKLQVVGDEARIGTGTPTVATGSGDLYVQDDLEVAGKITAKGILSKSKMYIVTDEYSLQPGLSMTLTCTARDANDIPIAGFAGPPIGQGMIVDSEWIDHWTDELAPASYSCQIRYPSGTVARTITATFVCLEVD